MKPDRHFHKEILYPTILFGCATIVMGFWFYTELTSRRSSVVEVIAVFGALLLSCYIFGLGINRLWFYQDFPKMPSGRYDATTIVLDENRILFPHGYFFRYASFAKRKEIYASEITEVNPNSDLPAFVINDNEVVFVHYEAKEKLIQFAKRNNLEIKERFDIWRHINMPFVDTQYTFSEIKQALTDLASNGIDKYELRAIRKRIGCLMLNRNMFAMNWTGLGQWDYLNWTYLTKKKYWWSMEIALRNYRSKKHEQNVA